MLNFLAAPPQGAFEAEFLAIQIENAIFNLFKSTDKNYKQRIRTRVMNLRDSNNPNLRINVFMGTVPPERLATMTSEVRFRFFLCLLFLFLHKSHMELLKCCYVLKACFATC